MGTKRTIIGIIVIVFGIFAWLGTITENIPTPENSTTIPKIFDFDIVLELAINSSIVGIGFMIIFLQRSPRR